MNCRLEVQDVQGTQQGDQHKQGDLDGTHSVLLELAGALCQPLVDGPGSCTHDSVQILRFHRSRENLDLICNEVCVQHIHVSEEPSNGISPIPLLNSVHNRQPREEHQWASGPLAR